VSCRSGDFNTVSCGICVPEKRISGHWMMSDVMLLCWTLYESFLIAINVSACRHWAYCIDRLPGSWLIPGYAALKGCPVLQTSDRSEVSDVEDEEEGLIGTWEETQVSCDFKSFLCRIQSALPPITGMCRRLHAQPIQSCIADGDTFWEIRRYANVIECTYTNPDSRAYYTQSIWYSLLLLGYKPVQHVTVLNTVGNCSTVVL